MVNVCLMVVSQGVDTKPLYKSDVYGILDDI